MTSAPGHGRPFELLQLRIFVAVAEELNFRRAARRLNMSQPPISRHIRMLEDAVGVRLLDRTNHSVRLTAAGRRFLIDAADILRRAESAALFARETERGEAGAVSIGFVPSASVEIVPRLTARLSREMPQVSLTLREMMTFEQSEALLAGSLDIGLYRLTRRSSGLNLRKVWSEPFVLAMPRGHALASREEIRAQDLDGVDFIAFSTERGGFLYEVVQGYLMSHGISPRIRHDVSQGHTIVALANQGLGVGIVARSHRQLAMPNVVFREIADFPPDLCSDIYMALGPTTPAPLVARVATLIADELAGDGPTGGPPQGAGGDEGGSDAHHAAS